MAVAPRKYEMSTISHPNFYFHLDRKGYLNFRLGRKTPLLIAADRGWGVGYRINISLGEYGVGLREGVLSIRFWGKIGFNTSFSAWWRRR